ncbi:SDR family NAD(P)-dependent oxidoreductase [Microbispora sp. ATCC PTA-5024]|uniref:SDR family NAD(P)-dependent oxidoreductase n=1 Tax=Microbispora sp. ATCC PTA-5024 TaxID=316330 RepID=UPI0003DC7082|nr:SDR family oxidoreductase [Microbispora sp. ATCC PTA-5024]ETK37699.1 hypothetical protein MPTA5024_02390 [Microbispora sp. ATCC PTA-5024]
MADPRVILVTGGAHGIGAAMVRRFTAAGHHVAVADVDRGEGLDLAAQTGCHFVQADVAVLEDNQAAVAEAVNRFGRLDAVCLNAGIPGEQGLGDDFDAGKYHRAMRVNLDGPVYGVNAAIPHLREGGGAILITSSLAGVTASPDPYYATAKHALIGLTRSLALLLQPDGITVNALCPGFTDTRLVAVHRGTLTGYGIAIAEPDHVAAAAEHVLDSGRTGEAWNIQADQPPMPVQFPHITLSMRDSRSSS